MSFQSNLFQLQARERDFGIDRRSAGLANTNVDERAWIVQDQAQDLASDPVAREIGVGTVLWMDETLVRNTGSSPSKLYWRVVGYAFVTAMALVESGLRWFVPSADDRIVYVTALSVLFVLLVLAGKAYRKLIELIRWYASKRA